MSSLTTTLERLLAAFADPAVDELFLNGADAAFLRRGREMTALTARPFGSDDELWEWLLDLSAAQGVRLDGAVGTAGGSLPELPGRWHCVLPPLSRDGPLLCVRRHRFGALTPSSFVGGDDPRLAAAVAQGRPLLIAGPTGAGKTSLLAALLVAYARAERVVVLETVPELPRLAPTWTRLAERPPSLAGKGAVPIARLFSEALRLSPDRLVIGELRGSEAALFQDAARTGHRGLMATIHAGTADEAVLRLRTLAGTRWDEQGGTSATVVTLARGEPPRVEAVEERAV